MEPLTAVLLALIMIGMPSATIFYGFRKFFDFREKQLQGDTLLAAEKAAQYAASNADLERRVRVLEQIVTDRGLETAAQIEALRAPRLTGESNQ
jgi:hypothetical protein